MNSPLKNLLRSWQGITVAVMASGPSSSPQARHLLSAAGVPVIATNNTGKLGCDLLYAADVSWWMHEDNLWALSAEAVLVTASVSVPFRKVNKIEVTGLHGYDPVVGQIRTGANSGYQAIHLAIQSGASKVLVLGVDMTLKHGVHWHGPHKNGLSNPSERFFQRCLPMFSALRKAADEREIDVVNCSPLSAVDAFRKSTVEKELGSCSSST